MTVPTASVIFGCLGRVNSLYRFFGWQVANGTFLRNGIPTAGVANRHCACPSVLAAGWQSSVGTRCCVSRSGRNAFQRCRARPNSMQPRDPRAGLLSKTPAALGIAYCAIPGKHAHDPKTGTSLALVCPVGHRVYCRHHASGQIPGTETFGDPPSTNQQWAFIFAFFAFNSSAFHPPEDPPTLGLHLGRSTLGWWSRNDVCWRPLSRWRTTAFFRTG